MAIPIIQTISTDGVWPTEQIVISYSGAEVYTGIFAHRFRDMTTGETVVNEEYLRSYNPTDQNQPLQIITDAVVYNYTFPTQSYNTYTWQVSQTKNYLTINLYNHDFTPVAVYTVFPSTIHAKTLECDSYNLKLRFQLAPPQYFNENDLGIVQHTGLTKLIKSPTLDSTLFVDLTSSGALPFLTQDVTLTCLTAGPVLNAFDVPLIDANTPYDPNPPGAPFSVNWSQSSIAIE